MTTDELKALILANIKNNTSQDITGDLLQSILISIVDTIDDLKVNKETGKGLSSNDFNTAMKNKLSDMPSITNYDAANNRIKIGSKTYQLEQYVPIPDYYIGWTSGTKSAFAALTANQLKALATAYMVDENPTYTHSCTDIIFFVMFKTSKAPTSGSLAAGGLVSPITAADFLAGGDCPHADVTIDGTAYKIYGTRNTDMVGSSNIMTVNFD